MDLSRYEDKREKKIEDEIAHLISSVGELNPFTPAHINEALTELKDDRLESIAGWCLDIRTVVRPTSETFEKLGRAIWCDIYEYWENMAREQSEKDTPSAYESYLDARAEAADARYEAMRDARIGL